MSIKQVRSSAAYRAVENIPRWASIPLGGGLFALAVFLQWRGLGDWPTVILVLVGVWIVFPDIDDAIVAVIKAWKGKAE